MDYAKQTWQSLMQVFYNQHLFKYYKHTKFTWSDSFKYPFMSSFSLQTSMIALVQTFLYFRVEPTPF
jgi:hypothetical protein